MAVLVALGGCVAVLGANMMSQLPAASAILAIYLARVGRLPNPIAILHVGAALGSIVVPTLWSVNASLGFGDLLVLLYPISWIAIGWALFRGSPASPTSRRRPTRFQSWAHSVRRCPVRLLAVLGRDRRVADPRSASGPGEERLTDMASLQRSRTTLARDARLRWGG